MKMLRSVWVLGFGLALAGCGGGNNTASPFNGTTLQGKDIAQPTTRDAKPAEAQGSVPVFLTVNPTALPKDAWISLNRVELQTATSSVPTYLTGESPWIRAASLRDMDGRRFLFAGMAPRASRFVRAVVELGDHYQLPVVGEEKPKSLAFGGDAKNNGSGKTLLRANLNPNAEFQDALVLELSFQQPSDEKPLEPTLALGSATGALDPDRQVWSFWRGKVAGGPSLKLIGVDGLFATAEGVTVPKKDDQVTILAYFDAAAKRPVAAWIEEGTASLVRGTVSAASADEHKLTLEQSAMIGGIQPALSQELSWPDALKLPEGTTWDGFLQKSVTVKIAEKKLAEIRQDAKIAIKAPEPEPVATKPDPKAAAQKRPSRSKAKS